MVKQRLGSTPKTPLQYCQTAQRLALSPSSARKHDDNRAEAQHALTFKLGHPMGLLQTGRAHFDRLGRAALQVGVLNGSVLVLHALRLFKSSPGLVALSCGHSSNSMVANIPRVLALPLGWLLMTSGGTMMQLLWLGIAAETVGFLLSMVLLRRRPGLACRGACHAFVRSGGGRFVRNSFRSSRFIAAAKAIDVSCARRYTAVVPRIRQAYFAASTVFNAAVQVRPASTSAASVASAEVKRP